MTSLPSTTPYNVSFNLETIFDILGAPSEFKEDFKRQDARRHDLRSRCEAFANIPRPGNSRLPSVTPGMEAAWGKVLSVEIPRKDRPDQPMPQKSRQATQQRPTVYGVDLKCNSPTVIADVLKEFKALNDPYCSMTIDALARSADSSADFARNMAQLIAKCLSLVEGPNVDISALEVSDIKKAWESHEKRICGPIDLRDYNRLIFFCALYENGMVNSAVYLNLIMWLAGDCRACSCRLQAIHAIVVHGDQRSVRSFSKSVVDHVLEALQKTHRAGNKVWELNGRKSAIDMLKDIQQRVRGWRKA